MKNGYNILNSFKGGFLDEIVNRNNWPVMALYPEIKNLIDSGFLKYDSGNSIVLNDNSNPVKLFKFGVEQAYMSVISDDAGNYKTYYPRDTEIRGRKLFKTEDAPSKNPPYVFVDSSYTNTISFGHTDMIIMTHENGKYNAMEVGFHPQKWYTQNMAETLVVPLKAEIIGGWSHAPGTIGKTNHAVGIKLPNEDCALHLKVDCLIDALSCHTKKPNYKYLATSIDNKNINCTSYVIRSLKNIGVNIKQFLGIDKKRIFSPGQLGQAVTAEAARTEGLKAPYMISMNIDEDILKGTHEIIINVDSAPVSGSSAYLLNFSDSIRAKVDTKYLLENFLNNNVQKRQKPEMDDIINATDFKFEFFSIEHENLRNKERPEDFVFCIGDNIRINTAEIGRNIQNNIQQKTI